MSWTQCRLLDTRTTPADRRSVHRRSARRSQAAVGAAAVQRVDVRSQREHPAARHAAGRGRHDHGRRRGPAARRCPTSIVDQVARRDAGPGLVNAGVGEIDIRSVYDFDGVDTAEPSIAAVANPALDRRRARARRASSAWRRRSSIPTADAVKLSDAAFGASNYMREILGYAPVEPDGSVVIQVPAYVAFRISILDAAAGASRRCRTRGCRCSRARVSCNGCHLPQAGAQQPLSHGRSGLFASAWAGASASRRALPEHHHHADHYRQRHNSHAIDPDRRRGDHGGGAHARRAAPTTTRRACRTCRVST